VTPEETGTTVEGVGRIIESLAQKAVENKSNHNETVISEVIAGVETKDESVKVTAIKPKRKRINDKSIQTDTNQPVE